MFLSYEIKYAWNSTSMVTCEIKYWRIRKF